MKVLTDNKYYGQIADVIREQNGTSNTYTPPQMVRALKDLFYEEVEGVPPITFQGIGENLLDYRIDGASGGVGDRTNNLFDKKNTEIIHAYFSPENLWQVNEDSSSIIIKVRPNTQYTLSIGTAISIFRIYKTSLENPEPGKNNVFTPIIRSSNINTYTFTTDNDTTYIIFQGTNADTEMWINSLILNIGSTSLPDYEPYGYKVPVTISGKNLFNGELLKGYYSDSTMTTLSAQNLNYKSIKIYLKKGNYTLSSSINLLIVRFITGQVYQSNPLGGNFTKTFTFEIENDGYVSLAFRNENNVAWDNSTNLQIEIGNVATDYEPYIEPTTTNIYLDNPIRTVEDEVEYIDYSEQKQHRVRKNLLQNTATSQTINGVTFTVNNDGSVTCNGTSSATTTFVISIKLNSNINYVLSGSPKNGGAETYRLDLRNISYSVYNNTVDNGNGINFTVEANGTYLVCIRIAANYTCNNLTFYPMIRLASIEDDTYEPYIENTEVDVTLPAIPTLDGTNVLSIDTTVQPSNVYVKSRHESSYEAAMRERYEEAQAQLDALESGGE